VERPQISKKEEIKEAPVVEKVESENEMDPFE
jgi:hypothetical protein